MKNKNGVDIEITEKELQEYATCSSCKKPSSYMGKMYWYNVGKTIILTILYI